MDRGALCRVSIDQQIPTRRITVVVEIMQGDKVANPISRIAIGQFIVDEIERNLNGLTNFVRRPIEFAASWTIQLSP